MLLKQDEYLESMEPLREDWAQDAINKLQIMIDERNKVLLEPFNLSPAPRLAVSFDNYDQEKLIRARQQFIDDPFKNHLVKEIIKLMAFDKPRFKVVKRQPT